MAVVRISNISDRPQIPCSPETIILGGQKLRPGASMLVDDSILNARHRALHGTRIWIGELTPDLTRSSASAIVARQAKEPVVTTMLNIVQVRTHLSTLTMEQLNDLSRCMTPPIEFAGVPSKPALVARLSRALFSTERELDPEVFFWLGRWTQSTGGFIPKE